MTETIPWFSKFEGLYFSQKAPIINKEFIPLNIFTPRHKQDIRKSKHHKKYYSRKYEHWPHRWPGSHIYITSFHRNQYGVQHYQQNNRSENKPKYSSYFF